MHRHNFPINLFVNLTYQAQIQNNKDLLLHDIVARYLSQVILVYTICYFQQILKEDYIKCSTSNSYKTEGNSK